MENNTQIPPVQPAQEAAPQPINVTQISNGSGGNEQVPSSGNKILLWFVIGLVIVVALVGGIYFLLSKQQASTPKETAVVQTPIPSPKEDLEEELNSINVDTATESSDFSSVDQDLQNL